MELSMLGWACLFALIFAGAALYSSIGLGGATWYLATMAIFLFSPQEMAIGALSMNILVSGIAFWRFKKEGFFDFRFALPFVLTSIPFAALGGALRVSADAYGYILSGALTVAGIHLLLSPVGKITQTTEPNLPTALLIGGVIGFVSGVVGVGGGIFLSTLLLYFKWATAKQTASTATFFVLVNSSAGLLGHLSKIPDIDASLLLLTLPATVGGFVGSSFGAKFLPAHWLKRILGAVLLITACRLILKILG